MVKPASGAFIQPFSDEGGGHLPQWQRVYRAICTAIASQALQPGARLPSARQLARDWRVARGAVDDAFAQLQLEGRIARRVGDGTYVSHQPVAARAAPPVRREPAALAKRVLLNAHDLNLMRPRAETAYLAKRAPVLHPRGTDLDGFPLEVWRRLVLAALLPGQPQALADAAPAGLPMLREAIARHLALQRGVACKAEQVLVLASPAEALNLLARVLLQAGDTVAVETPSHPSLPWLFSSLSTRVLGVPLDDQGFDVAALQRHAPHAAMVFLHPLNQYPLAQRTSAARSGELLDWARRSGAWIVETFFNDELWPREMQPAALFKRDPACVIVMGTFEGVMFPSQRLGYLVLPPALVGPLVQAQALWGGRVMGATQMAMAEFIDQGHMHRHLARLRAHLLRRRETFLVPMAARLPAAVRAGPLTPAPHWSLEWDRAWPDVEVVRRLRAAGAVTEPLSPMCWQGGSRNGLVLGYADWSDAALRAALELLLTEFGSLFPAGHCAALAAAG